jgi:hypothetical protein
MRYQAVVQDRETQIPVADAQDTPEKAPVEKIQEKKG